MASVICRLVVVSRDGREKSLTFTESLTMTKHSSRRIPRKLRGRRFFIETLEERRMLHVCDPDGDLRVTRADVAILAENFGTQEGASARQGDCNQDGAVDHQDALRLQAEYGLIVPLEVDYGDAQSLHQTDPPHYPTLLADNGARHGIRAGFRLGSSIDAEDNAILGFAIGNGDDIWGNDDESGIKWLGPAITGTLAKFSVTASAAGFLDAWVDFNQDKSWTPDEQLLSSEPLVAGTQEFSYVVPGAALAGETAARFRFSSAGGLTPLGYALDGEVEDYALNIYSTFGVPPVIPFTTDWDWEMRLSPNESTPGTDRLLTLEAAGPATFVIGPAVNMDNGLVVSMEGDEMLPRGPWRILLEALRSEPEGAMFNPEEVIGAGAIKDTDGEGVAEIVDGMDGTWHIDSFFDIAYEIEFGDSSGEMSLRPQDGSTRMEHAEDVEIRTKPELIEHLLKGRLAESEENELLEMVDASGNRTVWGALTDVLTAIPPAVDRGDAPDGPYPTLLANNGARHIIRNSYSMGPAVDPEADGQPSPLATRDDTNGVPDDEDGVVITSPIAPGGITTVDVTAVGGKGFLNAWADFNRDGDWLDAGEQIFTSKLLSMGVNSLSFAVPAATIPEAAGIPPVISRWRFSRQEVLSPTGLSSSGEVEDHLLRIGQPPTLDFGDAPDQPYPTLSSHSGASHVVTPGAHLGRFIDADTDGQPDSTAMKDDVNGGPDDDDGVTFLTPLVSGGVANVQVEASVAGRLNAFIDFDHDGVWDAGTEQVFANLPLAAGLNSLEFSVPETAVGGRTYARFRFSRAGGLGPAGPAPDGEVEDYAVFVEPAAEARTMFQHNQSDLEFVRGSVQFAPPTFIEVELGDEAWTQVLVPGTEAIAGEDGLPAVPIFRRLVAIPHGAEVVARSVRTTVAYDAKIDDVFGTQGLLPYQPAAIDEVTLLEEYPSELFDNPTTLTIDKAAYELDAPFPRQLVSFAPLGKLRDLDVGILEIAAGQYNPVQKSMTLYRSVDVEIAFTGGDKYFLPKEAKNPFENFTSLYEGVVNSEAVLEHFEPGEFTAIPCGAADVGEELLILTHPDFRAAADALAAWKEQKGIATTVLEVGAGTSDDTKEEIYDLIKFRYDNCPVRPSYAMFVGDAEFIPTWYHQQIGGAASVNADQDVDNGQWVLLGTLNFKDAGGEKIRVTRLERTGDEPHNGRTVADAVRLVKVGTGQTVTIDNDDPGFTTTGSWGVSDAVDQYGATSLYTNEVEAVATWPVPNLPGQGLYEVYAWWSAETESGGKFYRDTRARYQIFSANTGTDVPYSQVSDDAFVGFLPALAIGRLPVDTLSQANLVVNKIIDYEKSPPGTILDHSFYENATVAAAFEGYRGVEQSGVDQKAFVEGAEKARNTLMAAGYTVDRVYGKTEKDNPDQAPPNRYYDGTLLPTALRASSGFPWDGDAQDVIDSINDGRFLVIHRDHAGAKGWATPGFHWGHIDDLTNGDETPVMYSINCSTGNFDNETSGSVFGTEPGEVYFAERLLRESGGGAVGVIAATRTSSSAANTALVRGLVDATWTNNEPSFGGNTSIRRLGDILNYGKYYTLTQVGVPSTFVSVSSAQAANTMMIFQVFGDPTLEMWTGNPHHIALPTDIEYVLGDDRTIRLTYAAAGAKVTAFQEVDGKLMPRGRVMVDGRGEAMMSTLDLDPRLPVVFAACRDDAVCVAPTARRRIGGSPAAPAAIAVGAVDRVIAVRRDGMPAGLRTTVSRTPLATQTAVDQVIGDRADQDASSLRVLRALSRSRRAARDLAPAETSMDLTPG
jgi:hypothetical protein